MLDDLEKDLLERVIFEETLAHLLEEMGQKRPIVVDVLKTLIMKDFVQAFYFDEQKNANVATAFLDADKLDDFLFRITNKGLNALY